MAGSTVDVHARIVGFFASCLVALRFKFTFEGGGKVSQYLGMYFGSMIQVFGFGVRITDAVIINSPRY